MATLTADHLTDEQIDALGTELDALRAEVVASLGERDARYIHKIIRTQRGLDAAARALLLFAKFPPAWIAGTAALSVAKILENMELGHNIMHGQWDWMRDPKIHSTTWEWDHASAAEGWKKSHNFEHHTFTNVLGKDRDLGYSIMRISPDQKWHPAHLAQPVYNQLLALFFEWGVAFYDLEVDLVRDGKKSKSRVRARRRSGSGARRAASSPRTTCSSRRSRWCRAPSRWWPAWPRASSRTACATSGRTP